MDDASQRRWRTRPISQADFEWAFTLHREALGSYVDRIWGWREETQRRMFGDGFDDRPRQVIEVDGERVGVLEVEDRPDEMYLTLIELTPAWQGNGLGAEILRWLVGRAGRRRNRSVFMYCA
jgi:GNAT superfamily N-acetyltransferase